MGPPPLHWLGTGWWCSAHVIVVILLHVLFSFLPTWFLPWLFDFVFFIYLFLIILCWGWGLLLVFALMENNVSLLGLWALQSISFIVFPASSCWAFPFPSSLGPFKAPFFPLEEGHPTMTGSSILPMDQCVLFFVLYVYFFFLGLRGITPLFCFYSLIFPFSFFTWFMLFLRLDLCVHFIKNVHQQASEQH